MFTFDKLEKKPQFSFDGTVSGPSKVEVMDNMFFFSGGLDNPSLECGFEFKNDFKGFVLEQKTQNAKTVQEGDKLVVVRNKDEGLFDQPRLVVANMDSFIEEYPEGEDVDEAIDYLLANNELNISFESDVWAFAMPATFDKFGFEDFVDFGSRYNPTFDEECPNLDVEAVVQEMIFVLKQQHHAGLDAAKAFYADDLKEYSGAAEKAALIVDKAKATLDRMTIPIDSAYYSELQAAVGESGTSESSENILMNFQVNQGLKYVTSLESLSTAELAVSLVQHLLFEHFFNDIEHTVFLAYEFELSYEMNELYENASSQDSQRPIDFKEFDHYGGNFSTIVRQLLRDKSLNSYVATAKSATATKSSKDHQKTDPSVINGQQPESVENTHDSGDFNDISSSTLSHMERKFEMALIEIQKQINQATNDESVPFVRISQEVSVNKVPVGHVDMQMLLAMFYMKGGSGTLNIPDFAFWKNMTFIKEVSNMLLI